MIRLTSFVSLCIGLLASAGVARAAEITQVFALNPRVNTPVVLVVALSGYPLGPMEWRLKVYVPWLNAWQTYERGDLEMSESQTHLVGLTGVVPPSAEDWELVLYAEARTKPGYGLPVITTPLGPAFQVPLRLGCHAVLSATTAAFTARGGVGTVDIMTRCSADAISTVPWMRIVETRIIDGGYRISYAVDANGGPPRAGDLVIGGLVFSVRQSRQQWRIRAAADFNGDERPDLLWQHDNGALAVWWMDRTNHVGTALLNGANTAAARWRLAGAADVNGDTRPDLVWQHGADARRLAFWLMDGTNRAEVVLATNWLGSAWQIVVVTDGALIQRHTSGVLHYTPLIGWSNGPVVAPVEAAGNAGRASVNWRLTSWQSHAGGNPSLIWQHAAGAVAAWDVGIQSEPAALSRIQSRLLAARVSAGWEIEAAGDFDGDGAGDLVWRHPDGRVVLWLMTGTGYTAVSLRR